MRRRLSSGYPEESLLESSSRAIRSKLGYPGLGRQRVMPLDHQSDHDGRRGPAVHQHSCIPLGDFPQSPYDQGTPRFRVQLIGQLRGRHDM